ncbi:hypothetical protein Y602_6174 [Burkholderia pseudomallei MSHR733]|nr:hypothetical protein Y602_6174 [Burkholderia pseudomallei MSHR733]
MGGEVHKRVPHIRKLRNPAVELSHVFERDRLDFGACSRAILPECEQFPDVVDEKSEPPSLPNEAKQVDFVVVIDTVSRIGPLRGIEKPHALVVANHLRANARYLCSLADIHDVLQTESKSQMLARSRETAPWFGRLRRCQH